MKSVESGSLFQDRRVRFTVVHPNCIRIEESENGRFVDAPTLFAVRREARHPAAIERRGDEIRLDTGVIRLVYRPDGNPLGPANLRAEIRSGRRRVTWKPGQVNRANLGGPAETLDGWIGAKVLPDGLLSRDGWQVIDDTARPLLTDGWVRSRPKHGKDWYLFGYGTDYRAAFKALAAISGPVPLPRRYALGVWYSRYWPYTSKDYRRIVAEYEQHGFPLDVMVMDMDWHINDIARAPGAIQSGYGSQVWTGYTWDRELLPDAEKLLEDLHGHGLYVTLNDHPANGVQPHEAMYKPFMKAMGQGVGKGHILPFDAADRKYLETFYEHTHANLEKQGVDFWWLDWQQYRHTLSVPGLANLQWLNHYYYTRARENGKRGQSFSRWGGWGDHRNPIHFSGDADTGWEMLAFEVPFTAASGNAGCFFWSHDIGGHQGGRNEESYTRWCQFGAFSAALRSHSTRQPDMDRRPWTYPGWAARSMRKSFRMRSEWFPYLYSCAAQACRDTLPFIRPMYLDLPGQEDAYRNPQQYKLGDHLLVAPVAEPGLGPKKLARQAVWFPEGTWYDLFSGERFVGPVEQLVAAEIDEMPIYARGGAPLPTQPYTPRMGRGLGRRLVIQCWPGVPGETLESELYEDDGETERYAEGECARTRLVCTQNRQGLTLVVEPASGSFAGQSETREVTVVLPCTQPGATVAVNGKPARARHVARLRETRIILPASSIRERLVVEVRVRPSDPAVHRTEAFARRSGMAVKKGNNTVKSLFLTIMKSGSDSQRLLALRAAGIGLFHKRETVYGYAAKPTLTFYSPGNLPVGRTAQLAAEGVKVTFPASAGKRAIDLESLMLRLPAPDGELMMSARPVTAGFSLVAGGTALTVPQPLELKEPWFRFNRNLAPSAVATASSCMEEQPPSAAIDGVVDGLPGDRTREWASKAEKTGAWLRLDWKKPVTVGRILLFDRPNVADHILAGRLTLSDGTTWPVGELPADGKTPFTVTIPPRPIRWLTFEVTTVSGQTGWTGLSEIAVYSE